MNLTCESKNFDDYLLELNEVDYSNPIICALANELFNPLQTEIEKVKIAYEFVRDEISHTWDIQSKRVTCNASEVLTFKEGICYAKSNLLVALLRSEGIPTGFCYQRLMLFNTPDKGYCIHALNAVFFHSLKKWIRLDSRGNKIGIDAQFSLDKERLAFPIRQEFDEIDYPLIYIRPHPKTIAVLKEHKNAIEMYKHHLPERI
ncbi:transglutaminase family protein [Bacillus velezensis]|uniref:transglutaminase-like domain-containing protein n=1 Tax=Bacillus velezensis TaxID=492670 RepID=UPI0022DD5681|nr:transglutaminase family protein [Bacillus velezensis]WBL39367.1 transglutaminase family protein [Bacillus velezensis]